MSKKIKKTYTKKRQIGKTNLKSDLKRKALPPGKRISKNGKVYYEYRANRTDIKGKDTPKNKPKKKGNFIKKKNQNPMFMFRYVELTPRGVLKKDVSTRSVNYLELKKEYTDKIKNYPNLKKFIGKFEYSVNKPKIIEIEVKNKTKSGFIKTEIESIGFKVQESIKLNPNRNWNYIGFPLIAEMILKKNKSKNNIIKNSLKNYLKKYNKK